MDLWKCFEEGKALRNVAMGEGLCHFASCSPLWWETLGLDEQCTLSEDEGMTGKA